MAGAVGTGLMCGDLALKGRNEYDQLLSERLVAAEPVRRGAARR